jgi:hypothetical protein
LSSPESTEEQELQTLRSKAPIYAQSAPVRRLPATPISIDTTSKQTTKGPKQSKLNNFFPPSPKVIPLFSSFSHYIQQIPINTTKVTSSNADYVVSPPTPPRTLPHASSSILSTTGSNATTRQPTAALPTNVVISPYFSQKVAPPSYRPPVPPPRLAPQVPVPTNTRPVIPSNKANAINRPNVVLPGKAPNPIPIAIRPVPPMHNLPPPVPRIAPNPSRNPPYSMDQSYTRPRNPFYNPLPRNAPYQ